MVPTVPVPISRNDAVHRPNDLCQTCERVLQSIGKTASHGESSNVASTRDLLETSADEGCPLCLLFWNSLAPPKQKLMRAHYQDCIADPITYGRFKTTYVLGSLEDGKQDSFQLFLSNELRGGSNEDKQIWSEITFSSSMFPNGHSR